MAEEREAEHATHTDTRHTYRYDSSLFNFKDPRKSTPHLFCVDTSIN